MNKKKSILESNVLYTIIAILVGFVIGAVFAILTVILLPVVHGISRISGAYEEPVIALPDIPGLIEGASEGAGMGYKFLRHISRTKGLCYMVDLSDDNYLDAYDILSSELAKYSEELAGKEHILIGTKIDEEGTEERFSALKAKYKDMKVLPLSIYMDDLVDEVRKALLGLSGERKEEGFTSRMDTDAHYRDEA